MLTGRASVARPPQRRLRSRTRPLYKPARHPPGTGTGQAQAQASPFPSPLNYCSSPTPASQRAACVTLHTCACARYMYVLHAACSMLASRPHPSGCGAQSRISTSTATSSTCRPAPTWAIPKRRLPCRQGHARMHAWASPAAPHTQPPVQARHAHTVHKRVVPYTPLSAVSRQRQAAPCCIRKHACMHAPARCARRAAAAARLHMHASSSPPCSAAP